MDNKRGQIWSLDFICGTVILLLIIVLFFMLWNNLALRWGSSGSYYDMQYAAVFASSSLLESPGNPPSWETMINSSTISAIGLVNYRNEINNEKLTQLGNSNYSFVKSRLGLSRYQFGMIISDLGQNTTYFSFGMFPGPANSSVIYNRLATLNGTVVIVTTEVWA